MSQQPCIPGVFDVQIETITPVEARFYGPDLTHADVDRLTEQMQAIYRVMQDGRWRTLRALSSATGVGEASLSAQLRNMRRPEHGSVPIEKRNVGRGLWEYRLVGKD